MFDCGIHTTMQELSNQIRKYQENFIVSAVQELYVDIDKEKLEKCLNESKSFYDDGYKEGYDKGYEDALYLVLNHIKIDYAAYFARCMTGGEEDEDR